MARILAVGVATLDIINEVERYPREDDELRALAHCVRRGGNATNTLVVLSQLGHDCDWAGVLVDKPEAAVIRDELAIYAIHTRYCLRLPEGQLPTSYITLSRATGSRTIVHYRDLPEFPSHQFAEIPLQGFDWIHFEGRNIEDTERMMQRVRSAAPRLKMSLEAEKPRSGLERLFAYADLVQVSSAYAAAVGMAPDDLLTGIQARAPAAELVCTLGERGAIGLNGAGEQVRVDAVVPERVVDTLGAGDTYVAGLVDARLRGATLAEAMHFAAALSANKCSQQGLHGLALPERA